MPELSAFDLFLSDFHLFVKQIGWMVMLQQGADRTGFVGLGKTESNDEWKLLPVLQCLDVKAEMERQVCSLRGGCRNSKS